MNATQATRAAIKRQIFKELDQKIAEEFSTVKASENCEEQEDGKKHRASSVVGPLPFFHQIGDNEAASGGYSENHTCRCGATRTANFNQGFSAVSSWTIFRNEEKISHARHTKEVFEKLFSVAEAYCLNEQARSIYHAEGRHSFKAEVAVSLRDERSQFKELSESDARALASLAARLVEECYHEAG